MFDHEEWDGSISSKVDKAGKLIALKKGKAKITIKAGSKTYAKTVTVK